MKKASKDLINIYQSIEKIESERNVLYKKYTELYLILKEKGNIYCCDYLLGKIDEVYKQKEIPLMKCLYILDNHIMKYENRIKFLRNYVYYNFK